MLENKEHMDSSMKDIAQGMRDITLGDIVRLVRREENYPQAMQDSLAVAGYVMGCMPQGVTLSYQDPASPYFNSNYYHTHITNGDRFFLWKGFTHCELLLPDLSTRAEESEPKKKRHGEDLVGRVKAGIGSIVQLRAEELNVVGYVADFAPEKIMLIHHDPLAPVQWQNFTDKKCARDFPLRSGKRWYRLGTFNEYRILRSSSETPQ